MPNFNNNQRHTNKLSLQIGKNLKKGYNPRWSEGTVIYSDGGIIM